MVVLLGHWMSLSSVRPLPEFETVRVSLAQLPEPEPERAPPQEVAYQPPPPAVEAEADVTPEPEPDLVPPEPELPPEPDPKPDERKSAPEPVVPDELPEPEPVVPVKDETPQPAESSEGEETTETELEAMTPEASVQMSAPAGVDDYYLAMVQRKIGRRWEPTAAMARGRRDVKTVVSFRIGPAGEIMFPEVVESSGLSVFDRQALRAVLEANPVPKPPPRFARSGLNIRFTFVYNP
jgi:TonB family protein